MKNRIGLLMLVVVCAALAPGQVRADSDGYFCTGPGFLAYQLRSWNWHTMGRHVLRVVRFETGAPQWVGDVALKDFQPHLLECTDNRVTIGGYGRGWLEYEVDVTAAPRIVSERSDPERKFRPGEHPALNNLGDWSRARVVPLVTRSGNQTAYSLEIDVAEDLTSRLCRERTATVVRAADRRDDLVVYKGRTCETGGAYPEIAWGEN